MRIPHVWETSAWTKARTHGPMIKHITRVTILSAIFWIPVYDGWTNSGTIVQTNMVQPHRYHCCKWTVVIKPQFIYNSGNEVLFVCTIVQLLAVGIWKLLPQEFHGKYLLISHTSETDGRCAAPRSQRAAVFSPPSQSASWLPTLTALSLWSWKVWYASSCTMSWTAPLKPRNEQIL